MKQTNVSQSTHRISHEHISLDYLASDIGKEKIPCRHNSYCALISDFCLSSSYCPNTQVQKFYDKYGNYKNNQ